MIREWLLIDGLIHRPQPGFVFQITEIQKPMSDDQLRQVGKPGWGSKGN